MLGLAGLLSALGDGANQVVILCHRNADPDAYGSAYALSSLLRRLRPGIDVEIGSPGGLNGLTRNMADLIPIQVSKRPPIEKSDLIMLVDANTLQMLGEMEGQILAANKSLIIVDHHAIRDRGMVSAEVQIVDEQSTSTGEIVFGLFKEARLPLHEDEASALLMAITFDSRHFSLAGEATFRAAAELVGAGASTEGIRKALNQPMAMSERIARLKAANRIKSVREGDWIIATSHVSSYHASVARALLGLGADIVFVAGKKKDELSVSMRSTELFQQRTGIHLGKELATTLEQVFGGLGGGHPSSAGFKGTGEVEEALKLCVAAVQARLRHTTQADPKHSHEVETL